MEKVPVKNCTKSEKIAWTVSENHPFAYQSFASQTDTPWVKPGLVNNSPEKTIYTSEDIGSNYDGPSDRQ